MKLELDEFTIEDLKKAVDEWSWSVAELKEAKFHVERHKRNLEKAEELYVQKLEAAEKKEARIRNIAGKVR